MRRLTAETKLVIEGLSTEGKWALLGYVQKNRDPLEYRDEVIRTLRDRKITRYSKVRLAKYVTTAEIIGEDIPVTLNG